MNKIQKKTTAPDMQQPLKQKHSFNFHYNKLSKKEIHLVDLIAKGSEKSISMTDLAKLAHTSARNARAMVYKLCLKGVPIVIERTGKGSGYYIATNEEEREQGLYSQLHQVAEMSHRINAVSTSDLDNWQETTGYNQKEEKAEQNE